MTNVHNKMLDMPCMNRILHVTSCASGVQALVFLLCEIASLGYHFCLSLIGPTLMSVLSNKFSLIHETHDN